MLSALPSATWSVLLQMRTVIISRNSWYSCLRCRLPSHPCRFTCGQRGCSFPRLHRCGCHFGRERSPSSHLAALAWEVAGLQEMRLSFPHPPVAPRHAAPFSRSFRAPLSCPGCSPGVEFRLFPARDKGWFLPLRLRMGVFVLFGNLESSELWIAFVAWNPSTGQFISCYLF